MLGSNERSQVLPKSEVLAHVFARVQQEM